MLWTFSCYILVPSCGTLGGIICIKRSDTSRNVKKQQLGVNETKTTAK